MSDPDGRRFDLVLFGATGFTGQRAARRLAAVRPDGLRVALAGRREGPLRELADELGMDTVLADVGDPEVVEAMARSTRVLLSTAGPFAIHGDPVVDACAAASTHYADLTGEVPWMRRVIERHHGSATRSGALLVPASGFDSAPADLAVYLAAAHARSRGLELTSGRTVYRLRGGLNGGTLASVLHIFESATPRELADPFALIPGRASTAEERRLQRDPRWPEFDGAGGRWVVPFFMGPINRRVVQRSAHLRAERGSPMALGEGFRYDEFQSVSSGRGWLASRLTTLTLGAGQALLSTAPGRALFRRFGPSPGEGPSERVLSGGLTRAATHFTLSDGGKLEVRQDMRGDPGNAATVRILVETGLALTERALVPGEGGVLTPTTALGDELVRRLRATGEHSLDVVQG